MKYVIRDCEADLDAGRHHRQCRGKCRRVDIDAIAVEVVLGEEHGVHALFLGQLSFTNGFDDDLTVERGIARLVE